MNVAVNIISTIIKSAVNSKVGNELANELIGISVDDVSEKGISKINDFINSGRTKIEKILSKEKMKSMDISEDNIAYVIAEVKGLFSEIEITDDIFKQCKYDSLILCSFLWKKYSENKTDYIECESDIKKSLLAISEALIKLLRESEEFVKDISIQISNTVEDSRVEIQRISDYLGENFSKISADNRKIFDILREILEQNQKNIKEINITQEEKFQNNKKDEYLKIWNSRLFLHIDNDERPITLADAFIMPDYHAYSQISKINYLDTDNMGEVIKKFMMYERMSDMLIIGNPGIGKTSIISWLANEFKNNENVIILRFRDWESEELEKGLLKAICKTLKCNKLELENKILILDGFDEIKSSYSSDTFLDSYFTSILDFNNLKTIITSRKNYINPFGFHNFFELLPFSTDKISQFYRLIKNEKLEKNKIDGSNLNVIGIPVILYMAIMSDIDLTQKATKPELYSRIFAEKGGIFDKFSCEGIGYDKGNQILRDRNNAKKYLKFLSEIAFKMFEENKLTLYKDEYKIPELSFQGVVIQIMEFPIKYIFDNTESTIEFIHKSIYEYFVSEYICCSINYVINNNVSREDFASVLGELLKKNALSLEILEFLRFRIVNSKLENKFEVMEEVFQIMIQDGMTYYTGEVYKNIMDCEMYVFNNMLEILHLWNNCHLWFDNSIAKYIGYNYKLYLNLRDVDLSKVYLMDSIIQGKIILKSIKGADLAGANLRGADLRGVDLREVRLKGANLRFAKLVEADMRGISLEGANLREAYLKEANLKEANLRGADLREADLTRANLLGAELEGANLEGVNFTETIIDESCAKDYRNKLNLELAKVFVYSTHEIINFGEYCKRKEQ